MGTFNGVPLWVLLVTLSLLNVLQAYDETQQTDVMMNGPSRISFIQTTSSTPVIKAINTAHNSKICSTWGNFHFKNFDGDVFYFPGTCNYVFSSHCKSAYESFNIQIRRTVVNNVATIDKINMKMEGLVVQLDHNNVMVDDKSVQLPFSGSGVQIDKNGVYLKVNSKLGLVFMWNDDDSLLLELDEKYANQTCGLCGDYNGIPTNNEFISNGIQITETQFGNLQKLDGPTEQCQEVLSTPRNNCTDYENICEGILMMAAFSNCHSLVGVRKYIEACVQDLCRCDSKATAICLCNTFAEYSRQCAHAGGEPQNWRSSNLCPKTCPYNMKYQECGSPCADTCSNPERSLLCENHCLEGCFCPSGTVFDDINNSGCVPVDTCSCTFNGKTYAAGTSYSTECSTCMCSRGKWSCQNVPCPSTCAVEGGSHITTYDQTRYTIHGDCNYVLSKVCSGTGFTILAELRKCGLSESETCLKSSTIILNGGETIIVIKPCGSVYVNNIYTQLPVSAANVTIFRPSSFYIIVESKMGVQVVAQLTPFMQVYLILDPSFKTKTCGLCGNFNDKQSDDFQTISGVIEGTAASFANTWKTRADCPNVKNVYEDPCSLSVENEKFAKYWCGLIADLSGPFAECHSTVNPIIYRQTCMFDTCNCEKSEDCMCAAISSYVRACAAKGVMLSGWRSTVCSKYMNTCPKTLNYTYSITTCQPTCRSLSEPDATCDIKFFPVDGCTCTEGYYMDDSGKCVPAAACPCYYKGSAVPSGEVVHENGVMCTCTQGQLSCIGSTELECKSPMVFFDCKNASVDARGAECQKSCQILDMECYRTKCVSGCVCPEGLVADGKGGCIAEDQCPCIHNDVPYQPGEQIKMKCNTCTCKDRMWQCTNEPCLGTCAVYGDGHYITFDGKRYSFNGDCEYVLAQDHCGQVGSDSTFRVITENVPCGTTGTTCSKAIKVFLNNYEMILTEEHIDVLERGIGGEIPYTIRRMGIYLIIEADNGLILMWDQRTSIFIKLSKEFEGKVCGLCGNFDGDGNNDFTTRSMSVVGDVVEFGNSWKLSPMCPNVITERDACSANPYRKAWAQKQCSIINSKAFSACHIQVDPSKYYDACVTDSCACDTGGDCECFCTAVAAYAQACGESGVCVSWRTPSICPMFCDYYNPEGECEWHYKPCGAPCMKTCRNPSGKCLHELSGLEGCYPSCPGDKPFFDEDEMECVVECSYCYDDEGNHYKPGSPVTAKEKCQSCECTISGFIECTYNRQACNCEYQGRMYDYNDVIYNTTDGIGGCITAICKENGTVYRDIYACNTPTTTPFTFTTTPSTGTTTPPITTTPSTTPVTTTEIPTTTFKPTCTWSSWIDVHIPGGGMDEGDFETYENIHAANKQICQKPDGIQCRAENYPETPIGHLGQVVQCDVSVGLVCKNEDQEENVKTCLNYQVKVLCCSSLTTPATSTAETTTIPKTTTTEKGIITTTQTPVPPTTTPKITAETTTTTTTVPPTTRTITTTTTTQTTTITTRVPPTPTTTTTTTPKTTTEPTTTKVSTVTPNIISETTTTTTPTTTTKTPIPPTSTPKTIPEYTSTTTTAPPTTTSTTTTTTKTTTPTSERTTTTSPSTTKEAITTTKTPIPPTSTPKTITEYTSTTTTAPPTMTSTATTTTKTTTPTSERTTTTTKIPPPTTATITTSTTPKTTTEPTTTKVSTVTPNIISETTTTTTPTTTTKTPIPPTSTPKTIPEYTSTTTTAPPTTTSTTTTTTKTTTPTSERTTTTSPSTTKEAITTTKTPIPPTSTPKTITEYTSTTTTAPPTMTSTATTTTKTTTPTSERTTTTTKIPPPTTATITTSTTPKTTTAPTTTKISTITPKIIPETTTTTTTPTTTAPNTSCGCQWSNWFDVSYPTIGIAGGDFDTFDNIRAKGYSVCNQPSKIDCRAKQYPDTPLQDLGQNVQCNASFGLLCYNKDQFPAICYNYEIRVCCSRETCTTTGTTTTSPTTTKEVTTNTKTPMPPTSTPKTIPEYTFTTTTAPPSTTSTTTTTTKTTTPTSERTTTTTIIPPPTTITTTTSSSPKTTTTTAPTTTKVSTITPNIIPETTTTTTSPITPTSTPKTIPEYTSTTTTAPPMMTSTTTTTTKTTTPTSDRTTTTTRIPPTTTASITPETTTTTAPTTTKISTITPKIIPETTTITTTSPTTTKEVITTTKTPMPPTSTPKTFPEYTSTTTTAPPLTTSTTTTKTTTPTSDRTTTTTRIPPTTTASITPETTTTTAPTTTKISTITPKIIPETTTTTTTPPTTTKEVTTNTKTPIPPTSTPKTIPEYTFTTTTAPPSTTSTTTTTTKTTTPTSERTTTTTIIPPPTTITTTTSSSPKTTTTTAPTTTKVSTITPNIIPETTTTTTSPITTTPNTSCGCQWSNWFDVSYPTAGIAGGDFDTFDNIRAKGYSVCNQPSKIDCRAKQYPDTPLEELGQKVQCNASVGLLCYNKDQVPAICYNYEIRVCCSRGTCTTTPQTSTITKELTTTDHLTTKESTQFTTATTTRCYCRMDGEFFLTGAVIYNRTDEAGCHFYAICNEECNAERFQGPCQPTTLPPPTTTTTPVSTTTTSIETTTPKIETTTPVEGCPPRKTNETWSISNCTVATCHGNNVVTFEPVSCPPVEIVTCDNGFPPVKVYSADGCCYHYECECVCGGWGDPHYITFDGTYYTFLDNCTYVLVQQITPKFDNFRILVDNYFCDAADGLSCPQSIIVYYKSNELLLTRTMFQGRMRNMIRFNQNWVTPGFTADGIIVSSAGINMVVEIPEIKAYISFSGLIFVIKLPFSMFGYNTEGQCGTCSNNSTEDCRLPDGKVVEDCSQMAAEWRANFTVCNPPPEPTPSVPPTDCPSTPLCDVILSDVFAECHKKISPEPYYKGCVYDACRIRNDSVQCSSLEVYAAMCASIDVCVDWRGNTEDHCPYYCPAGKVYDPCGPVHCDTCENREVPSLSNGMTEGCYCPSGTKLFNTYADVCVKSCPCVGPDGMPKAPAEKWISNCQECVCEATSLTVQCSPLKCVQIQCAEGFEYKEVKDQCCGICEPVACTMKMTDDTTIVIKPGETWNSPVDKCSYYQCNKTDEQFVTVSITKECTVSSADGCRPGYTYRKVDSECCGTCVQEACTMMMKDNSTKVLEPEETWTPPNEPCLYYECHKIGDQFVPTTVTRVCSIMECSAGYTYIKVDSECCGTCKQEECTMKMKDNSTKVLKPGEKYTPPDEKCISYLCTDTHDVVTEKDKCDVADEAGCSEGYNYTKSEDECCGKCVRVACTMKMKDDSIKVLKPGEKYTPADEKCTSYICTETYDLITEKERCLVVSPTDCSEGYNYTKAEGDCCGKCETVACTMKMSDNSTKVLKPEETWTPPNEPCLYYECHKIDGQFVPVNVMSVCSVLECSAGYMYKKAEGDCCGSCEMVACTMKMDNNTIITLMPGEKYTPPDQKCTSYTCNSTYHVVTENENCNVSSSADCSGDFEYRVMPGKCCGECVKVACTMKMDNNTTITLKSNETWSISNCTVAKCNENDVVTIEPVTCKSVEEITCASGFPPVKVYDSDGCCYHYECECVCTGWGDPHYITFDGTYYTFLDNCTYVLVQQITPKFDNFRVLIDNYFCGADDGLSCPQSLLIYYKSNEVLLTRTMFEGRMRNRIRFNQLWVTPGFTTDGITVSSAGINMVVEIPEIKAYISFSGMIFVIKLPFGMFGYNTEGQCGTCSNNSTEDCRLPNGEVIEDCSEMATQWRANVSYCNPPPEPTPTPSVPPTACPPAPLCDVILSDVFAECHAKISPEPYHEGCVFDACRIRNDSVQCSSLEIYASLCASIDVCVDWRAKTGVHCPYNCPAGKMYDACGPVHADTCDNRQIAILSNGLTEGCYCPSGTKLFNAYTDVCVESCSCVGPDGMPKASGEKWTSNCQECFCEATSLTVQCTPLKCDQIKCAEGFQFKEVEDQCCGGICEPVACTMKMNDDTTIVIKPGETWNSPVDKCSYYQCNKTDEQFVTMSITKECTVSGADGCRPGYKYSKVEGECCGTCDPVACTMMMNDSSTKVLEPEETWTPPNEPCLYYECHKIGDQFVPITVTRVCAIVECSDGYNYTKAEGECCGTCVPVACTMKMKDNSTKVLKPGEKYTPADEKCVSYICTDTYDVITEKEKCLHISPTDCSEGYTYKEAEGNCCGSCVPEACTMKMKDNSTKVLKPGEKYTPADEKCTSYICTEIYNVVTEIEKCLVLSPTDCSQGYKYAKSEGECCGTCVPEACTMKMKDDSIKVLKPGEKYTPPDEKCVSYICTDTYDVVTEREKCIAVSPTDCSEGYQYKKDELTCCGTCEQVACTMKMKDNSTKILKPEETWTPPNEPCLYYECHKIEDQFVPVTVTRVCSVVECSAGYMFTKLESECCGLCVPSGCTMKMDNNTIITLKPGEKYTPLDQNCVSYTCNDSYHVVTEKENCPVIDPADCLEGFEYKVIPGKCCGECVKEVCTVKMDDNTSINLKTNETWSISNCTVAKCHGNDVVTIEPVTCPPVETISCENGFPPVKVYNSDGCCYHYQCECVCAGWGDPHYITFDGTYYTFLDNCTYVLVQQITPKFDNFRVLIDNYFCGAADGLSCPQSLLIYYKSNEVLLTRTMFEGRMRNRIRFNQHWVTPGFTIDGITVSSSGINMVVEIPEINAYISFSGLIFVIKLPFTLFGYNTEGQCGTCSNNSTEDCRLPDGEVVADCSEMATQWRANVSYCNPPPEPTPTPSVPPTECPPAPLCDVILSDVFAECHEKISPEPYYEGCVFDACRISNYSVQCSSLEVYAALCASIDVCVDWRAKSGGHCPYNCPAGKVYNACGPVCQNTCENRQVPSLSNKVIEGCYCPSDTTLFNSYSDVCVKSCACVGPDGMPREPSEKWTSNCQECFCEATSLTVQCTPLNCDQVKCAEGFQFKEMKDQCCGGTCEPVACTMKMNNETPIVIQPGETWNSPVDKCSYYQCNKTDAQFVILSVTKECTVSSADECKPGYTYKYVEGECCGTCVQEACTMKMKDDSIKDLKPGEKYTPPDEKCVSYICTDTYDVVTEREKCLVVSPTDCSKGTKYTKAESDCCGSCVAEACTMAMKDNSTKVLQPGERYTLPEEKCTSYICTDTYDVITEREKCLVLSAADCSEGYKYTKAEGDCCGSCEHVACTMKMKDESTKVLQPGEKYTPADEKCTSYICTETYNVVTEREKCLVASPSDCSEGYTYSTSEADCCGKCVPVACTMQMQDNSIKVLKPGEKYTPADQKCTSYICTDTYDLVTEKEKCLVVSPADCTEGFNYTKSESDCCGSCVQEACTMKMNDNSIKVLKPGEKYTPADEKCTSYICTETYDLVTEKERCLVVSPSDCSEGYKYTQSEGECCGLCEPVACTMKMKDSSIKVLQPGEKYTPADEKCTSYICTETYTVVTEIDRCLVITAADCSEGYKYTKAEGDCCGACEPVACTMKMKDNSTKVLQPGEKYTPADEKCTSYICTETYDLVTEKEKCLVVSPADCTEGYTYSTSEVDCCGKCVPVACTMKMQDNSIKVLKPGEKYTPADQKCTSYICTDTYDLVTEKEKCLVVSPADCTEGFNYTKSESDCCGSCVQEACTMKMSDNSIKVLKPGEKYTPVDEKCTSYICTETYDLVTEKERCLVMSPSDCSEGSKYTQSEGECCGLCEPVACTMKMKDSSIKVLQPGEKYTPADEKCTTYICTETYNVVTEIEKCLVVSPTDCSAGYKYTKAEGDCCGSCEPVACTMKMKDDSVKVLQPGEKYTPADEKCTSYICTDTYILVTEKEKCLVISPADCSEGYTYKQAESECCGSCEPVACTMKMKDNSTKVLQPGEKYTPPDEKCISYICTDAYDLITEKETCPAFNLADCLEGTIKMSENGCCKTCEPIVSSCQVYKQSTRIITGTCESDQTVELSYCEGGCKTTSMYSAEANTMEHKCSCCQEMKTSKREVSLKCLDGTSSLYSYIYVEECGCTSTECNKDPQTSNGLN
ncbi:mucin-5B-like [Spea bombifrons]|uniref:mucin-5B-like n=1 Tax=Spea bombifrons TaxID=233779 RepID=UPI00234B2893|nr:mucin-5B-like [Spea bombifrons]